MTEQLADAAALWQEFTRTRAQFLQFCAPLSIEDHALQAAPFTSPPKWHLAHTTWFFETFLLKPYLDDYTPPEPLYEMLFNSYYNAVGEQFPRPRRGLLSRPSLDAVLSYRDSVESAMHALFHQHDHQARATILERTRLGIEHEWQHQELFFTDLKYSLSINPLLPAYVDAPPPAAVDDAPALRWQTFEGGLEEIGHDGGGFCFDNELPRHRSFIEPFALANRLVTNAEYADFIADGGYQRPELWLADGWTAVQERGWRAPLYWLDRDGAALEYTLYGAQPRRAEQPVCHVSGYEADAYARWAQARLPREQEWELAARAAGMAASGVEAGRYQPQGAAEDDGLVQLCGACWQWTQSAYSPYPGYRPSEGAIGEYNGKFMSSQWVLRGGSCVSRAAQLRPSYRNFFYPPDRWQFSGIRLARDLA